MEADTPDGVVSFEAPLHASGRVDSVSEVGNAKPFVVESASQFRTAGPYPLDSAAYAADFNEVKAPGAWNSVTRTFAQTPAAALSQSNPAANYHAIARTLVDQLFLNLTYRPPIFGLLFRSPPFAFSNLL